MSDIQTWVHDGKGWKQGETPDPEAKPQRFHRIPGHFKGHGVTAELWTLLDHEHRDPAKDGWHKVENAG